MKILLVGIILLGFFKGSFKISYTGHGRGSSDNLGREYRDVPVKFLWIESNDSSWATMQIFRKDHASDTIAFSRLENGKWKLLRWLNHKEDLTYALVDINQDNDSIKIELGFGYSGYSYYAKKDSLQYSKRLKSSH
jgi:hypothetical protein